MKVHVYKTETEWWNTFGKNKYDLNIQNREKLDDRYDDAIRAHLKVAKGQQYGVSDQAHKDVRAGNPDLGNGLELIASIALTKVGSEFSVDLTDTASLGVGYGEAFGNMADLVTGVKSQINRMETRYLGMVVTPYFFTTCEDEPVVPAHISADVDGHVAEIKAEAGSSLGTLATSFFEGLKEAFSLTDRMTGFSAAERQEFERLY